MAFLPIELALVPLGILMKPRLKWPAPFFLKVEACVNLGVIRRIEDHIDDINNRNRRNNIVIHGVPEGSEAGQTCEEFVHDLLTNHLKLEGANSIEIDRARLTVLTAPVNHQTWLQPAHVDQGSSIADYFATVTDITS